MPKAIGNKQQGKSQNVNLQSINKDRVSLMQLVDHKLLSVESIIKNATV